MDKANNKEKTMNAPRNVYIKQEKGTIFVVYSDRVKNGRHYAAQFAADMRDIQYVTEWVKNNPKLNLKG